MGIKNNTRIIGVYTKLRTIPLSHTGIKNNTRIIAGIHYVTHYRHCMGIKINTHTTSSEVA